MQQDRKLDVGPIAECHAAVANVLSRGGSVYMESRWSGPYSTSRSSRHFLARGYGISRNRVPLRRVEEEW